MKQQNIERGAASFTAELYEGTITVVHADGTILYKMNNVKEGSWDKIWQAIHSIETTNNK